MSLAQIALPTTTFESRGNGLYADASVQFGGPSNTLKIRPNTNTKSPSVAIARSKQIDIRTSATGADKRIGASVQVIVTAPSTGFTPADLAEMVDELGIICSASNLSRMLQGSYELSVDLASRE